MLATLLRREDQSEVIREIVYNQIPVPLQQALAHQGIDPGAFACGANFILQHIQVHGLPDDWAELVNPPPPDPAKVSEFPLTEADGPAIASEVEEFMAAWMKYKNMEGGMPLEGYSPPELC